MVSLGLSARIALVCALALASLWWVTPARASTSYTFGFVGANQSVGTVQTWVVPADVTQIYITARGGDGAGDTMPNEDPRKYGGHGAVVTMTSPVTVTPGATLSIYVAGQGDPGRGCNCAGKGGWGYASGGQGGSGYAGGGGGGASAVVSSVDGLLIVAGGGGGAGAEIGADGGTAAHLGTAAGGPGLGTGAGGGGDAGLGGSAGVPGSLGVAPTAGLSIAGGGTGGAGAMRSAGSRYYPFGGGGGGGYGGGGGGGGDARSGTDFGGAGGGAGGSYSAVAATYAPSTLPWSPSDLRYGNAGEVTITLADLTPVFDTPVRMPDGYTVNVTNYDSAWSWTLASSAGTATAGVATGSTLPVAVTGLGAGASSTLTVTTTRTGYAAASDTATESALDASLLPTFDAPMPTEDGFTVNLTNYDPLWTWSASSDTGSVSVGAASGANLPLLVTGLGRGATAVVTIDATRAGYADGAASVTGSSMSPPAPRPPSAPSDLGAEAGDRSASLSWSAPSAAGSFTITNYQVRSSPTGGSCLTSSLSCEVSGLTNGTAYTFQVRALNGAGWGPWSEPSDAVVPGTRQEPPESGDPSIVIAGSRSKARGTQMVVVTGATSGLKAGIQLRPMLRFPGQSSYSEGSASVLVDTEGAFTWSRSTGKRIYVYFVTRDGALKSNRVVIDR